jgi:hypothetical protein
VRVAWLGDSHGAADFWSGTLRSALQKRFGSGGVGFVNVGSKSYRHDAVTMDVKGTWKISPKGPSTTLVTGDGVFGLSGMLLTGVDDNPRATLTITESPLPPSLRWDLCYRLNGKSDEIRVTLPGMKDRTLRVSPSEPVGALLHVELMGSGDPALSVTPTAGFPSLCGVVVESDPKVQPGVVLDTLGINGARLATPLAWNEASWVSEMTRRAPSLVILEYGTNESGDHSIKPASYLANLGKVMARVRKASPSCDCLVLAPTDRCGGSDTGSSGGTTTNTAGNGGTTTNTAGAGGSGGSLFDGGQTQCTGNADCNGGVCVDGVCCASADLACAGACCDAGKVCLFDKCVKPGDPCHTANDCAPGQYCETALGDNAGGGGARGGGTGGAGGGLCTAPVPLGGEMPRSAAKV